MAESLQDDTLAEEHAGDDDSAWLDIAVPKLVHAQLATFGERVGLTAEGYAKLLLFQALHPLIAAEPQVGRRAALGALDDGDVSREMWAQQLAKFKNAEDLAPAPIEADEKLGWRTYQATDFQWPNDISPVHDLCTVTHDGNTTVKKSYRKA